MIFAPGIFEYVALRMARRWLFPRELTGSWTSLIPHYKDNLATDFHVGMANMIESVKKDSSFSNVDAVEIGSGSCNNVGYEFAGRGARSVICVEPYRKLDLGRDRRYLISIAQRHGRDADAIQRRVRREKSFEALPLASVDMIFSTSVIEHINDLGSAFSAMKRILRPSGTMIHVIDFRDHFFKYPYHFLLFSQQNWDRFLNPGDLPRWRLYNVLEALERTGFRSHIHSRESNAIKFEQIRPWLHSEFVGDLPGVDILSACIVSRPSETR